MSSLEKEFIAFLARLPSPEQSTFLLAISGGLDSVVLGHLCFRFLKTGFALAYFDHQLREKKEQECEKTLVTLLAEQWGVPFFHGKAHTDLREKAREKHKSLEELAREERYEFLYSVKRAHRFAYLATAHHKDDQLETFLMRLSQRSSWASLLGIRSFGKEGLIRPLLQVYRQDIEEYAKQNGLKFCNDSSNKSFLFLRNRFRHILLPSWQSILPQSKASLLDWQERLRELYVWSSRYLPSWKKGNQLVFLSLKDWINLPVFLKKETLLKGIDLLYQLGCWRKYPQISARFLDTLERRQTMEHQSILLKGHSIVLSIYKDQIFLKPLLVQNKKISYLLKADLYKEVPWLKGRFYFKNKPLKGLLLASYDRRWDFWKGSHKKGKKFFSCYVGNFTHNVSLLVYWGEIIALWEIGSSCFLWKKEKMKEELIFILYEEGEGIGAQ